MRDKTVSASQRAGLEQIQKATERARTLIGQLLAFSRKQELNPQPLNLSTTVSAIRPMLEPLLGSSIQLVLLPEPDVGLCEVDANSIEQVIINLVINARDAMPNGGTVTVATANLTITQENAIHHDGPPRGDYILLTVSDSWDGYDGRNAATPVRTFFTTKETGKGTGRGLSHVLRNHPPKRRPYPRSQRTRQGLVVPDLSAAPGRGWATRRDARDIATLR